MKLCKSHVWIREIKYYSRIEQASHDISSSSLNRRFVFRPGWYTTEEVRVRPQAKSLQTYSRLHSNKLPPERTNEVPLKSNLLLSDKSDTFISLMLSDKAL